MFQSFQADKSLTNCVRVDPGQEQSDQGSTLFAIPSAPLDALFYSKTTLFKF